MSFRSLTALTNEDLFFNLSSLHGEDCRVNAEIILHLWEVNTRKSFREKGFSSLFTYCTEGLKFSKGSAYRREKVAQHVKASKETYDLIASGELTLCALAEVVPVITEENHNQILQLTQGRSKQEAAELAVSYGAPAKSKREVVRARKVVKPLAQARSSSPVEQVVEETKYSFAFEFSEEAKKLFDQAKELVGHVKNAEVFERAIREFVLRRTTKPARKVSAKKPVVKKEAAPAAKPSRYIPRAARSIVRERDACQCTYVSPDGRRCSEKVALQFDHIVLHSRGGTQEPSNLRLRCHAHNQLYAEQCLGREFMQQFKRR